MNHRPFEFIIALLSFQKATKNAPLCTQMMSKKMQEKFKDEMNNQPQSAAAQKEADIMSENVDGGFRILLRFKSKIFYCFSISFV